MALPSSATYLLIKSVITFAGVAVRLSRNLVAVIAVAMIETKFC